MRVTMHPDQFILINSLDAGIYERSVAELVYHARVLDLMGLDGTHKVQIHVGGVYGDKEESISRFASRYRKLPAAVRRRLVVENDERSYGLADCLEVNARTGVPVVFDTLHHAANNRGERLRQALIAAGSTWKEKDGLPMVDYSSQKKGARLGAHAYALDPDDFRLFLRASRGLDRDVMLEVKNKERSALEALSMLGVRGLTSSIAGETIPEGLSHITQGRPRAISSETPAYTGDGVVRGSYILLSLSPRLPRRS